MDGSLTSSICLKVIVFILKRSAFLLLGCTSGIGEALCLALASRHPEKDLILIGRNKHKLESLAAKLKTARVIDRRIIRLVLDLSCESDIDIAAEILLAEEVGILINAAGQSYSKPLVSLIFESGRSMITFVALE